MKKLMDILPINNRNENNETLENYICLARSILPRLLRQRRTKICRPGGTRKDLFLLKNVKTIKKMRVVVQSFPSS